MPRPYHRFSVRKPSNSHVIPQPLAKQSNRKQPNVYSRPEPRTTTTAQPVSNPLSLYFPPEERVTPVPKSSIGYTHPVVPKPSNEYLPPEIETNNYHHKVISKPSNEYLPPKVTSKIPEPSNEYLPPAEEVLSTDNQPFISQPSEVKKKLVISIPFKKHLIPDKDTTHISKPSNEYLPPKEEIYQTNEFLLPDKEQSDIHHLASSITEYFPPENQPNIIDHPFVIKEPSSNYLPPTEKPSGSHYSTPVPIPSDSYLPPDEVFKEFTTSTDPIPFSTPKPYVPPEDPLLSVTRYPPHTLVPFSTHKPYVPPENPLLFVTRHPPHTVEPPSNSYLPPSPPPTSYLPPPSVIISRNISSGIKEAIKKLFKHIACKRT